mmetsp:Transcript_106145/g.342367  ORF Transcript_106145/g.342367 Transcript_106145/m.342367 type:complete len:111 (-) Transcript_106145:267-599(-)
MEPRRLVYVLWSRLQGSAQRSSQGSTARGLVQLATIQVPKVPCAPRALGPAAIPCGWGWQASTSGEGFMPMGPELEPGRHLPPAPELWWQKPQPFTAWHLEQVGVRELVQ